MPAAETGTRILFVDDEPGIRLTLSTILRQNGFDVTTVATVSDALAEIGARQFHALVSDLNIGEPGDGFTVVSAMRRTQPQCVNLILTGYPAFESALQAIRSQVDDYLVKPADVRHLVELLQTKLRGPRPLRKLQPQPLPDFLRDHAAEITNRALATMKSHLPALPLTDAERVDRIPDVLAEIVQQLQSGHPRQPREELLRAGIEHGQLRKRQGYSPEMLVDDVRALDSATYAVVQDHLLKIELSGLIPMLGGFNEGLEAHLRAALGAFHSEEAA